MSPAFFVVVTRKSHEKDTEDGAEVHKITQDIVLLPL
jgi:hypothetical protein